MLLEREYMVKVKAGVDGKRGEGTRGELTKTGEGVAETRVRRGWGRREPRGEGLMGRVREVVG